MRDSLSAAPEFVLGAAALEIAAAGRAVLPLKPDGKAPLTRHGVHDATCQPALIRYWWKRQPLANIGLRTGHGLVVIDVDTQHGGAVDPSWPATRIADTRSGGYHLYYSSAELVPCSVGTLAPGVDVRGEGGYVVCPPSPGWTWANDLPIVELPEVLRVRIARPRRNDGTLALPGSWEPFEPREHVGEGERNPYLARLAGWLLRNGVTPLEMADYLRWANAEACCPSLPEKEVERIAASVARYHA